MDAFISFCMGSAFALLLASPQMIVYGVGMFYISEKIPQGMPFMRLLAQMGLINTPSLVIAMPAIWQKWNTTIFMNNTFMITWGCFLLLSILDLVRNMMYVHNEKMRKVGEMRTVSLAKTA